LTVSTTSIKNSYSGNGSTTAFAYTFKAFASSEIKVFIRTDSTGAEAQRSEGSGSTNYSVSGVGNAGGGTVTFVTAPASGETVVIRRQTAQTQGTDYVENDPFPAEDHETALDKLTHIVQEVQEEVDRSFKVSKTNSITTPEFTDDASTRASKLLGFSSDGNTLQATTGRVSSVSVSNVAVSGGASQDATVSYSDTTGALALGIPVGSTGATGSTGSTGAAGSDGTDGVGGLLYTFSTTTSDADPGAGVIRLNNGTLGSVSQIYIDDSTAASGNPDVSAFILTWDDSTQTSDRGQVTITKKAAQQNFATYKISGASTDASGYVKLAVTHVVSNGSFSNSDAVLVSFVRTGNAGSLADPMTTRGDVIIRDSSNATARLAAGSANTVLTSDGTDPSYAQVATAMIADDAVSLAKMASGTDGNLITYDASGNPAHVATGSSGQVLTSNGAGAAPTFQAAGGGLNHLTTATASSSASLDFTSLITSTYDVYLITLDEIMPATHAADLYLRLSGDNGSTFSSTNYAYVTDVLNKHNHNDSVVRTSTGGRGLAQIELMNGAAVNQGQGVSGSIYLFSPLNTALQVSLRWSFIGNHSDKNIKVVDGAAKEETSSARDAFQILFHTGNIASGTVRVYGIAN
tara:strand:+ start:1014 stop:2912 length:1899 start_codon:yes stop_codon:yes gene_type:complete